MDLLPIINQSGLGKLASFGANVSIGLNNAVDSFDATPLALRATASVTANIKSNLFADIGIVSNLVPQVSGIASAVASRGIQAATNLFNGVTSGLINKATVGLFDSASTIMSMASISPDILGGHLTDATNVFSYLGVQDTIGSLLPDSLASTLPGGIPNITGGSQPKTYDSPAAAMAISDSIPKSKFLFVLEVIMNQGFQMSGTARFQDKLTFIVKSVTRPKLEIQYEKVNMYNFRTNVPKTTVYEPISIKFYDDSANYSMKALMTIMRGISPIFNVGTKDNLEDSGMDFVGNTRSYRGKSNNSYSAALGPLQTYDVWKNNVDKPDQATGSTTTPIQEIRVYHLFNSGQHVNLYKYFNPRIMEFTMDPLTMVDDAGPMGNEISLQFNYDAMFVDEGVSASDGLIASVLIHAGLQANRGGPQTNFDLPTSIDSISPISSMVQSATGAISGATGSLSGIVQTATNSASGIVDSISQNIPTLDPIALLPAVTLPAQLGAINPVKEATNLLKTIKPPANIGSIPIPPSITSLISGGGGFAGGGASGGF